MQIRDVFTCMNVIGNSVDISCRLERHMEVCLFKLFNAKCLQVSLISNTIFCD